MPILGNNGLVNAVAAAGLPAGFTDTGSHAPITGSTIDSCDTLNANWGSSHLSSNPALDTVNFVEGVASVTMTVFGTRLDSYGYRNFPAPLDPTGHSLLALQVRPKANGPGLDDLPSNLWQIQVCDGQNLTGNMVTAGVPDSQGAWAAVYVPLGSLTSIGSIGIRCIKVSDVALARNIFNIDVIAWPDETELDAALASANAVTVLVPATYTPTGAQAVIPRSDSKTVADFRPGHAHISGLGGVRHIREWGVEEDGLTEVTDKISRALAELKAGEKLQFTPGGLYWVDGVLYPPSHAQIDGGWCSFFTRTFKGASITPDPTFMFDMGCQNVRMGRFRGYGYHDRTTAGASLTADGGAPSGGVLAAQGDTLKAPNTTSIGKTPMYARYPWAMFPTATRALITAADPAFVLGNAFVFRLSDSAHVASDCVIEAVANDDPNVVLATRTLTLTSAPTDYVLTVVPADLRRPFRVRVRKATATANSITVGQLVEYGYTDYDGGHDQGNFLTFADAQHITVGKWEIEGAATDAVDVSGGDAYDLRFNRFTSRCSNRQGVSFNLGTKGRFADFTIIGAGRSGIDVEPYNITSFVRDLKIERGEIYNSHFQYISCAHSGKIFDLIVDRILALGHANGFNGGAIGAQISNIYDRQSWEYWDDHGQTGNQWSATNATYHNINTDCAPALSDVNEWYVDQNTSNYVTVTAMTPAATPPAWQPNHAYLDGDQVQPTTPNGLFYTATAGTSGATEPTWPTGAIGGTVTDDNITWTSGGGTTDVWTVDSVPSWLTVGAGLHDTSSGSSSKETVKVTAINGTAITVQRAMDSTVVPVVQTHTVPFPAQHAVYVASSDAVVVSTVNTNGKGFTNSATGGSVHISPDVI